MTRQNGFTILELVAALMVLALVMTVTLGIVGDGSRLTARGMKADRMALQARSFMEGLGLETPLSLGDREGVLADGKTHWHLRVLPHGSESATAETLYRLELVLERDGMRQRFSTLRLTSGGPSQ